MGGVAWSPGNRPSPAHAGSRKLHQHAHCSRSVTAVNPKPCQQGAMRPEAEQPRPAVQSAAVATLTDVRKGASQGSISAGRTGKLQGFRVYTAHLEGTD